MRGNSAVVIGGSMAGLLAARVLSDLFDRVIVLERDVECKSPIARAGVPQGAHFHALLAKGYEILCEFFPGLEDSLLADGAVKVDVCNDFSWHHFGGWKLQFVTEVAGLFASRPFIEFKVRELVSAIPNVTILHEREVCALQLSDDRSSVDGVEICSASNKSFRETIKSDLVVDASGRTSQLSKWLADFGFDSPKEETMNVGVGYTTRIYERSSFPARGKGLLITPKPPFTKRTGGLFPIEGNRWICTLGGWHADHAPRSDDGFLEFAKSLPASDIYDIISKEKPVSAVSVFKYPVSKRYRYELLKQMPKNIIPIGDSICSFNPIYGQGMTVCALEARALGDSLSKQIKKTGRMSGFEKHFIKTIANEVIDVAWTLSTCEDLRFPETVGNRNLKTKLANIYVSRIHELAKSDAKVLWKFYKVMNMLKPPSVLFHPTVLAKALFAKSS